MGDTEARQQKKRDRKWKRVLASQATCKKIQFSLGTWICMMPYLTPLEQICLQLLCFWVYQIGVPRSMKPVSLDTVLYFTWANRQILELRRWSGATTVITTDIDSESWQSVEIRNCLFQFKYDTGECRTLEKAQSTQLRIIKRARTRHTRVYGTKLLCNFENRYIFATGGLIMPNITDQVERYDFFRDIWEEMPPLNVARSSHGSCTLGTSVYVLCGFCNTGCVNSIEKLETRNLQAGWLLIQMPPTSLITPRDKPVVAALNSHEILIMGGWYKADYLKEILIFDSRSNLVKVAAKKDSIKIWKANCQSLQVRPGVVAVAVEDHEGKYQLLKYENGTYTPHKF